MDLTFIFLAFLLSISTVRASDKECKPRETIVHLGDQLKITDYDNPTFVRLKLCTGGQLLDQCVRDETKRDNYKNYKKIEIHLNNDGKETIWVREDQEGQCKLSGSTKRRFPQLISIGDPAYIGVSPESVERAGKHYKVDDYSRHIGTFSDPELQEREKWLMINGVALTVGVAVVVVALVVIFLSRWFKIQRKEHPGWCPSCRQTND